MLSRKKLPSVRLTSLTLWNLFGATVLWQDERASLGLPFACAATQDGKTAHAAASRSRSCGTRSLGELGTALQRVGHTHIKIDGAL